jgi:hypothetical protein
MASIASTPPATKVQQDLGTFIRDALNHAGPDQLRADFTTVVTDIKSFVGADIIQTPAAAVWNYLDTHASMIFTHQS